MGGSEVYPLEGPALGDSLFTPTEVTADLETLEKKIHQLGVDYEVFFTARADGKVNVPPPTRRQAEVEAITRHYLKSPPRRTADRFRFNTLVHRYRMSCERWSRRLRKQEEQGIVGRGSAAASRREAIAADDVSRPQVLAATRAPQGAVSGGQVRDLFSTFRGARKARGQAVADLSYGEFAERLAQRIDEARRVSPGRDLELRVDEVQGRVRVAVRPPRAAGGRGAGPGPRGGPARRDRAGAVPPLIPGRPSRFAGGRDPTDLDLLWGLDSCRASTSCRAAASCAQRRMAAPGVETAHGYSPAGAAIPLRGRPRPYGP